MRDNLRRVGRMIRAAEQAGPGAAEVVQTVTSPAAGWVQVDSAGATYPARVPGSLREHWQSCQLPGERAVPAASLRGRAMRPMPMLCLRTRS